MQGGAADRHSPESRQDLRWRQGTPFSEEVGYLLHDAVPELLGAETVELVLEFHQTRLDAHGVGLSSLGPRGERGVPSLRMS